jgi:transcriptional pleiotropic repressor
MEKSLLDKVREINRNLLEYDSQGLNIERAVSGLGRVVEAGIYVLDQAENLLACLPGERGICDRLEDYITTHSGIPAYFNVSALRLNNEPQINVSYRLQSCPLTEEKEAGCRAGEIYLAAFPVFSAGQRVGTLLLLRGARPFEHDDTILAEICAAVIGLLFMQRELEQEQESARNKDLAAVAFESLSYSEVEAMEEILKNLTGDESIVVASKIADELGITRSVIVNALRKFESAGIIESRSLGMKGTYVRVKNPQALQEIAGRTLKMKQGKN